MTPPDMELEHATEELKGIVERFNDRYADWEGGSCFGANFGFEYDSETGRKRLKILDIAAIPSVKPSATLVAAAGTTLRDALDEVMAGKIEIPKSEVREASLP